MLAIEGSHRKIISAVSVTLDNGDDSILLQKRNNIAFSLYSCIS